MSFDIWFKRANGESSSSKSRRSSNKENARGKKPDLKLLTNTKDKILFGEVKPPCKNSSLLVNKDLVKLANFQAGALDELIAKYGNRIGMATYGIWVCGKFLGLIFKFFLCICQLVFDLFIGTTIRIYNMDLEYDGIYRMFLITKVIIPTEQAQFISLVPVLESFFNVKVSGQRVSVYYL